MNQSLEQQFEHLIANMVQFFGFTTELGQQLPGRRVHLDLVFNKGEHRAVAEIKFYRSRGIDSDILERAAAQLLHFTKGMDVRRFLITGAMVPVAIKDVFLQKKGVVVWDRSNIFNFLWVLEDVSLLRQFEELLLQAQQGTSAGRPFDRVIDTPKDPGFYFQTFIPPVADSVAVSTKGATLSQELENIFVGKAGATSYEAKCAEVLRFLFEGDLTTWEQQLPTDDQLSRFDLICRILPRSDFWTSLMQSFNSRFILFECKNYSLPITQAQIYTTERYLYPKALRSIAFIIARNEATEHALVAAKGALREHGKLILLLSHKDLKQMLEGRDAGNSPNDYLSEKLDEFLISLSR